VALLGDGGVETCGEDGMVAATSLRRWSSGGTCWRMCKGGGNFWRRWSWRHLFEKVEGWRQ